MLREKRDAPSCPSLGNHAMVKDDDGKFHEGKGSKKPAVKTFQGLICVLLKIAIS